MGITKLTVDGERVPRVLINAVSASAGGGWTYLVNLVRELGRDPRGFDITILVSASRAAELPHSESSACRIEVIAQPGAIRRAIWEQLCLPWKARSFDVLYCVADVAPLLKTTPTVVALRNLNIHDRTYYDTARLRWLSRASQWGLLGARRILFPSRAAAERISLLLELDDDRTAVVPHGIDTSVFQRASTSVSENEPSDRYILVPAAVERHKNLEVAIASLSDLEDNSLHLWIAGNDQSDPEYKTELQALARAHGVEDRVRFLGPVDYAQITALYMEATIALLPSLLETFGHPLLESMSAGVPLVVGELPVFTEVAQDAAWYFDPRSASDLARAVNQLLHDAEERDRRIQRGLNRVRSFSWSSSVDRLCQVLRDVTESPPPRRSRPT